MTDFQEPPRTDPVEWAKAVIAARLDGSAVVELLDLARGAPDGQSRMASWALGFGAIPEALRSDTVLSLLAVLGDATRPGPVRGQMVEAVAELLEFADHVDPVRGIAAGFFIDLLNDASPDVRFWCAFGLGKMGATPAVPFLRELTIDTTSVPGWWTVGQEAADAIASIEGRQPAERHGHR